MAWKLVAAVVAAATVVLAAAYWFSPRLVPLVLADCLRPFGVTELSIRLQRPGWSGVHLEALSFVHAGHRFDVRDTAVAYTLSGLLAGRIAQVRIEHLEARLAAGRAGFDHALAAWPAPAALWEIAPVEQATIRSLRIQGLPATVAGRFAFDAEEASAALAVADASVEFDLQRSGALALRLADPAGIAATAKGSLDATGLVVALTATLSAESVRRFVALPGLDGTLETELDIALPRRSTAAELIDGAQAKGSFSLAVESAARNFAAQLRGEVRMSDGRVAIGIQDGTARLDEIVVRGISAQGQVRYAGGEAMFDDMTLAAATVDVGFPIRSLRATIGVSSREPLAFRVGSAAGQALGGAFSIDPFAYDASSRAAAFDVRIEGIEVADVVALQGDAVTGSGVLDGIVPVRLEAGIPTVAAGRFEARSPGGVVRYSGAADAAPRTQRTGLDFALRALGDFRYQRLAVDADYSRDGTLALGILLEGRNPEIEAGRPIHYNLNVRQDLPALLKSLQLSDRIGRRVERALEGE